ncbi:hypothetical protein [Cellulomonas uda]|uniref:Uncharacterized protein n=1 Tax=Cellulomonas uda TaxID=1714 RepID=A0A4Y3K7H5_CELUD|nr:hypothetical protein [Cellulomonas uda]NII66631.1 hypothetical protein [Cellulomonas uda]GEA79676.1 hypothetical protein CUD01_01200 [Cellulomonas uda]
MTNEPRFQDASWVRAAFPAALRPVAAEVARALAPQVDPRIGSAYTASPHIVPVQLDGESIAFPYRIYHGILPADTSFVMTLSPVVAACAYTRHHDGHVRQKAVRTLLDGRCALQPWVVPYVVKLVDEYVVEIVEDVAAFLTEVDVEGSPQQRTYGRVLAQNPEMLRLLRARAASYWDCYYRWRYRRLEEYPGRRLALALSRAAALEKASWPPPRP